MFLEKRKIEMMRGAVLKPAGSGWAWDLWLP